MAVNNSFNLLNIYTGTTEIGRLEFQYVATGYRLRAAVRNDASAYTYTGWTTLTDSVHVLEIDWRAATGPGANNGSVALWIDQVAAGSVTTLDNDTRAIDTARLGAVFGLDTGTTGAHYFDAFEDRRVHTVIGAEASLPDRLFTNSFESNSLANWVVYGAGITTTTAANLAPGQSIGAAVVVTSTQTNRYLEDLTPNRESRYRARVYFDPNGLTMAVNNSFNLLNIYTGTTEIGRLEFQYVATGYRLRAAIRNDASAYTYTPWTTLTDSAHVLEIDWRAATGPGANNGGLTLWIDGTQVGALTTVDNDTRRVDRARIGAVGLAAGTTGTFYLDAFESRRESAIGPVQVAGSALTTTAITYGYDPLYRLTSATYSDGTLFGYAYDAVGNVLTKTQTIAGTPTLQTYAYDDANRQTSAAGLAQTYDNNGNLLNDGATAYTWDGANRMTVSGSTAYTYNGLNDRVSAGGATHRLDLNTGLTQVLAEGANTYLYGAGRLGEQRAAGWAYHQTDALGSVRQLTTATGAVSLSRQYDPYGQVMSSAGTGTMTYGFTGEQTDASGLVYLRARYYAPGLTRFITRDGFRGNAMSPMTLNGWAYTEGNPINRTDPSGYCSSVLGWMKYVPINTEANCRNIEMAQAIYNSDQTSFGEKALAATYVSGWAFAGSAASVGTALGIAGAVPAAGFGGAMAQGTAYYLGGAVAYEHWRDTGPLAQFVGSALGYESLRSDLSILSDCEAPPLSRALALLDGTFNIAMGAMTFSGLGASVRSWGLGRELAAAGSAADRAGLLSRFAREAGVRLEIGAFEHANRPLGQQLIQLPAKLLNGNADNLAGAFSHEMMHVAQEFGTTGKAQEAIAFMQWLSVKLTGKGWKLGPTMVNYLLNPVELQAEAAGINYFLNAGYLGGHYFSRALLAPTDTGGISNVVTDPARDILNSWRKYP